jgi:hypothetical protein
MYGKITPWVLKIELCFCRSGRLKGLLYWDATLEEIYIGLVRILYFKQDCKMYSYDIFHVWNGDFNNKY